MGRVWQVRKLVRKMMEAKEAGGDPSKVPSLEALQQALKGVDLDRVVARAVASVPDVDPAVIPKAEAGDASVEISTILRTASFTAALRPLAELYDQDFQVLSLSLSEREYLLTL